MPIYSYGCTQCGDAFDTRQSFDDAPLAECERCGGRLRKRYDSIGVTFNGPGFYRTDSREGATTSTPVPAATSGTPAGD